MYDQKVLIVAHSWGDNVARNFLTWMDEIEPGWVEQHVAVHFNVAGPVLGVPKALTSLLSGKPSRLKRCLLLYVCLPQMLILTLQRLWGNFWKLCCSTADRSGSVVALCERLHAASYAHASSLSRGSRMPTHNPPSGPALNPEKLASQPRLCGTRRRRSLPT